MCIATAYLDHSGQIEQIMQDVVSAEYDDNGVSLTTILGERQHYKATIKHIDFIKHTLTIQSS